MHIAQYTLSLTWPSAWSLSALISRGNNPCVKLWCCKMWCMTKRTNYFMSLMCLISQIPNITMWPEKQMAFSEKPFKLVTEILHRNYHEDNFE